MKLSNYAPPGINLKLLKIFVVIGLVAAVIFSFSFVTEYSGWKRSVNNLTEYDIVPVPYRADCAELMDGCFSLLPVGAAGALAFSVYNYIYLYQGSKSIYTLKRLPKKGELFKRIVALPVASAVLFILTGTLLMFIYYGAYMLFTPEGWRNPSQLQIIWESLRWLI